MPQCLPCQRGFIDECDAGLPGGCPVSSSAPVNEEGEASSSEISSGEEETKERTRRYKNDASLKDQQSTGRKRAAKLYPLDREAACEWRDKPNSGGGNNPIQGCTSGLQQAIHHGPDYSTLNNEPENVNRICHSCHNRWHAANDKTKSEAYLKLYGHVPKKLGKEASLLQEFLESVKEEM